MISPVLPTCIGPALGLLLALAASGAVGGGGRPACLPAGQLSGPDRSSGDAGGGSPGMVPVPEGTYLARNGTGYVGNAFHDRDGAPYQTVGIHAVAVLHVDSATMTARLEWVELRFDAFPWSPFKQDVLVPALREAVPNMAFRDMAVEEGVFCGDSTLSVDARWRWGEPVYTDEAVELKGTFRRPGDRSPDDPCADIAVRSRASGGFGTVFSMDLVACRAYAGDGERAARGAAVPPGIP